MTSARIFSTDKSRLAASALSMPRAAHTSADKCQVSTYVLALILFLTLIIQDLRNDLTP